MSEELCEIGLPDLTTGIEKLEFAFIREVIEPPVMVENRNHMQMRIFRVYALETSNQIGSSLRYELLKRAENNENLILATADQIRLGRAGRLIGHQAGYLFTKTRVRPNEPEFES